ncbi:MAG: NAD-dependent epimerase/dehydratase family protein [Ruminococcus sp.]|nr:NAD-dependent epimerase/dehydratase family protein [Ruminococcus sp.]
MRILVTGGTTFVSRYVAQYFVKRGDEVFVINRNTREQVKGVHLIKCDRADLGDKLKNVKFDAVLDICTYNQEQLEYILDALNEFDDYIFISSSAVYPETNKQPFTEDQQCGNNSVWGEYGINKLNAERLLQSRVENAYILRPPYFYGIYENLYREAFAFDCAEEDRPFYIPSDGDMKMQFFNVKDLCRFIEVLLIKHPKDKIFNVGNKDSVSIKEWVSLCYKAVEKEAEFISVDSSVNQRDYFPFYNYEYELDVSKQEALMNDTIPLFEGLKEEYEWYKNNKDSIYNRKPYIEFIDNNLK